MNNDENGQIKILEDLVKKSENLSTDLQIIDSAYSQLSVIQDNLEKRISQIYFVSNPINLLKINDNEISGILHSIHQNNSTIRFETVKIINNNINIDKFKIPNNSLFKGINIKSNNILQTLNILLSNFKNKLSELNSNLKEINTENKTKFTTIEDIEGFNSQNRLLKEELFDYLKSLDFSIQNTLIFIQKLSIQNTDYINNDFLRKIESDSNLIIKKLENKIENLMTEFDNKYKEIQLDQDKIKKSNSLLIASTDIGLKNLNDLNDRTQNLELVFTKEIHKKSESINVELNDTRIKLMGDIDVLIKDANSKSESITNSYNDFKNIVEKAGIYELTTNYKEKADDEKIEYKAFRKFTAWSILAAVGFTLAVFIFAFFEKSGSDAPPDYLILISRLSISAMFFILALYLSKQASKHYECYQENHRTFLQLAALEPFMARMSADEQKEIRKGLIPSYFNQNTDGKYASKGDEVDMAVVYTLLDKVSNLMPGKKNGTVEESETSPTK